MRVLPTLVVLTVLAAAAPASARPSRHAQELPPRVAAASAAASARAAELAPCDAPDGPLCGTVQVPLDRADPSGPAIGRTSVIGSPSSQCACAGQAATTASKQLAWRSRLIARSPASP